METTHNTATKAFGGYIYRQVQIIRMGREWQYMIHTPGDCHLNTRTTLKSCYQDIDAFISIGFHAHKGALLSFNMEAGK